MTPTDEDTSEPGEAPEPEREGDADAGSGWPLLSDLDLGVCLAARPQLGVDADPRRATL